MCCEDFGGTLPLHAQRSLSDMVSTMLTVHVLTWHCLRAWWRGSLTQSILIELRRLPAPHQTFTLCGCKSLHRLQLQPSSLHWLQLLRLLIGHYPDTSYYDRLEFILCCYIKFTVIMILSSNWRIAVLPYLPFDIKNSPGYYCIL